MSRIYRFWGQLKHAFGGLGKSSRSAMIHVHVPSGMNEQVALCLEAFAKSLRSEKK